VVLAKLAKLRGSPDASDICDLVSDLSLEWSVLGTPAYYTLGCPGDDETKTMVVCR